MTATPESRAQTARVFEQLIATGEEYNLGGTGEPVAIVVVYPNAAFLKAGWGVRKAEDIVTALLDAITDEASK